MRLGGRIDAHVAPAGLGHVFGSDAGVLLERNPDTVREPDVAYVSAERLPLDYDDSSPTGRATPCIWRLPCPVAPDLKYGVGLNHLPWEIPPTPPRPATRPEQLGSSSPWLDKRPPRCGCTSAAPWHVRMALVIDPEAGTIKVRQSISPWRGIHAPHRPFHQTCRRADSRTLTAASMFKEKVPTYISIQRRALHNPD